MILVNNFSDLQEVVLVNLFKHSDDVAQIIVDKTKDNVDKVVYQAYIPTDYERTNQLRDSIACIKKAFELDGIELYISHNYNEIIASGSNQHTSVESGEDVSKMIPYIVSKGKAGTFIGYGADENTYHQIMPRGTTWGKERDYMAQTVEDIETDSKILKDIVDSLKNSGVDVTII